jgi:hypothetical protein
MPEPMNTSLEIQNMFEQNKLDDLKYFMNKRKCLNSYNMALIYLFHIIQSAGILTTTIAAGYDMKSLVWAGVGLNILASLINVFEKTNNSISKRLMADIQAIKDGSFVDEGTVVEIQAKESQQGNKEHLLSNVETSSTA